MSGALAPGERLAEKEWAERLGISRGPVREAIRRLAADGLVDIRPRRAAIIHRPTEKELDDFFDARQVIEVNCAQLAAQRANEKGAQKLRQLLDSGRKSLLGDDAAFLSARLSVSLPGIDQDVAQALVDDAHESCPYSKATRGNIDVAVKLV